MPAETIRATHLHVHGLSHRHLVPVNGYRFEVVGQFVDQNADVAAEQLVHVSARELFQGRPRAVTRFLRQVLTAE